MISFLCKKLSTFILFSLVASIVYGKSTSKNPQSIVVPGLDMIRLFTIKASNGDTIHFIKANEGLDIKKPTLIFCQGSTPVPLIISEITDSLWTIPATLNNINLRELAEKYNIIEVSMPHTPHYVQ